ncbi:TPA: hypothetical protein ND482_003243, partial [Citrobacter farmeri]|nr:hypothetical protein [Citrobacter farmeri]
RYLLVEIVGSWHGRRFEMLEDEIVAHDGAITGRATAYSVGVAEFTNSENATVAQGI